MSEINVTRGYGLLEGFLARQRVNMTNKLLNSLHKKKERILDIGCGAYPLFLMNAEFSEKYGLDKIRREEDYKKLDDWSITLINYDIETGDKIPFESGYFNAVTMLAVFEHIEPSRLIKVLNEVHRVLSNGGIYVMTTPAAWTDGLLRKMAKLKLVSPVEIEEHKDTYNISKITGILQKAGFQEEKIKSGYFEMFVNIWATAIK